MFKRKLTQGDIFLIAANLLPVIGVWFFDWDPKQVFLVYCIETIIIGFFNLVKMGIVTAYKKTDVWQNGSWQGNVSGLFFMFFFLVHYGMFVGIQMAIFFGVSGLGDQYNVSISNFFYKWPQLLGNDAYVLLAAFVFSYGYKLVTEFLLTGQYRSVPLGVLMFQPYLRIFIQQFTVIIGSMFLVFHAGRLFILIFALIKTAFEVMFNYDAVLAKAAASLKKSSQGDKA